MEENTHGIPVQKPFDWKQFAMAFVYFGLVCNTIFHDITRIHVGFQEADTVGVAIGAASITIASSANIASYLAAIVVYCLHSHKSDGEDGKQYVFGDPPGPGSLSLITMFFAIPRPFR